MRPLRLEIEGFTSFRNPVHLDMSELDLFAITGPTGAGKSSLIDAIAYALYGRVPRVTAEVGAVISLGMERMRVTLEFLAGEDRYRVYRETRRKGAPNVRLDRWRDGDWQAQLDRAREVTERIEQIVGLDYDGFTRSVLLPQGQFQEFLAGSAEKRRAVLGSLLRLDVYNRMRGRATAIAAELKTRLDERERALEALADATPENAALLQEELNRRRAEATCLQEQCRIVAGGLELAVSLNSARADLARAEAEAQATRADLAKVRILIEQGDAALSQACDRIEELQRGLEGNCYDPDRLTRLTVARERATALEQICRERDAVQTAHKTAESNATQAEKAIVMFTSRVEAAEAAVGTAEAALDEARRHNLVAAIAADLHPGDSCPVCGGEIGRLPAFEGEGLEIAKRAHESARKAEAEARSSLQAAVNGASKAAAALEGSQTRLADLEAQMARQRAALAEALEGEALTLEQLAEAIREQNAARQHRETLQGELDGASAERQTLAAQLTSARDQVADLEARLDQDAHTVESLQASLEEIEAKVCALATAHDWHDVIESLETHTDVLVLLRRREAETRQAERDASNAAIRLEERLERLHEDVERARALRKDIAALKKDFDVAADLAQMLRADRFQAYIQQEALATLAEDGSRRLEKLSAGRYRLRVDEKGLEFEVVDQWNADQARSVRTLSGGETFLASLALSLALAESLPTLAASRRVVLDSVFLDEGFGSLDAEALDRAADALDALRSENRMVCVVTHLPELAQRLPARVAVTRSEAGSTVAIA
jgi:exonuclease SbcC